MKSYIIRDCKYSNFIMHEVFMNNKVEYAYYEKKGNSNIDKVYFVISTFSYIGNLLENSIYLFCSNINNLSEVFNMIKGEYSNVDYYFVLESDLYRDFVNNFCLSNNIEGVVVSLIEYLNKVEEFNRKSMASGGTNYKSDITINPSKKEANNSFNNSKDCINYKGFNEAFIDRNVKNIVEIKKGNGGNHGV